jgi:hypothetical protein
MYLQSIKSVKHNAAKSVNRSILKESRHIGFGVVWCLYGYLIHALTPIQPPHLVEAITISLFRRPPQTGLLAAASVTRLSGVLFGN